MSSKIFKMKKVLSVAVFMILVAGASDAQSEQPWPSFQGPYGSGVTTEKIPRAVSEENILWEKELPGRGLSTPLFIVIKCFLRVAAVQNKTD